MCSIVCSILILLKDFSDTASVLGGQLSQARQVEFSSFLSRERCSFRLNCPVLTSNKRLMSFMLPISQLKLTELIRLSFIFSFLELLSVVLKESSGQYATARAIRYRLSNRILWWYSCLHEYIQSTQRNAKTRSYKNWRQWNNWWISKRGSAKLFIGPEPALSL